MMYAMRHHSPELRDRVDKIILKVTETGIKSKLQSKYLSQGPDCNDFNNVSYRPVSLNFVYGAYAILAAGYVTSILIAVIESRV